MSFNFGNTATGFSSGYEGPGMVALRKELAKLRLDLARAQSRQDRAKADAAAAETVAAGANDAAAQAHERAEILWGAYQYAANYIARYMDEDAYNAIGKLQQERDELKQALADKPNCSREDHDRLVNDLKDVQAELRAKTKQLEKRTTELETLRDQLKAAKSDLDDAKKLNASSDDLLTKAYADTENVRAELRTAQDARDDWEAKHRDVELSLASLRTEWNEQQERIAELERINATFGELENQVSELSEEVTGLVDQLSEKDQLIEVKQARIAEFEDRLQNALVTARTAQNTAEAARSPTAEPVISPGESLHSELAEIAGDEDFETVFGEEDDEDHIEFVGVLGHATIITTPVEPEPAAPAVSTFTTIIDDAPIEGDRRDEVDEDEDENEFVGAFEHATVDTAPVQPQPSPPALSTISTIIDNAPIEAEQPEEENEDHNEFVGVLEHATVVTASAEPQRTASALSAVTTTIDDAPVDAEQPTLTVSTMSFVDSVPIEIITADNATQTDVPASIHPDVAIHTTDIATQTGVLEDAHHAGKTPAAHGINVWKFLSAPLALYSAYLYFQLQAWQGANTSYRSSGAYGNPVDIFGIIPIGYDIGGSYFSEAVARHMASLLQSFEAWAGVDRVSLH
jgi:hypothetical protein